MMQAFVQVHPNIGDKLPRHGLGTLSCKDLGDNEILCPPAGSGHIKYK